MLDLDEESENSNLLDLSIVDKNINDSITNQKSSMKIKVMNKAFNNINNPIPTTNVNNINNINNIKNINNINNINILNNMNNSFNKDLTSQTNEQIISITNSIDQIGNLNSTFQEKAINLQNKSNVHDKSINMNDKSNVQDKSINLNDKSNVQDKSINLQNKSNIQDKSNNLEEPSLLGNVGLLNEKIKKIVGLNSTYIKSEVIGDTKKKPSLQNMLMFSIKSKPIFSNFKINCAEQYFKYFQSLKKK